MDIRQAFTSMTQKEFVDWAIENKYPYFIAIEGNRERGFVWAKRGAKRYDFDYKINTQPCNSI